MDMHARTGGHAAHGHTEPHLREGHAGAAPVKDPVCGMNVPLDAGKPTAEHGGS